MSTYSDKLVNTEKDTFDRHEGRLHDLNEIYGLMSLIIQMKNI